MRTRIPQRLIFAGCLLASGCANVTSIEPGMTAVAVEASQGKPSRVWPEAGGGTSWEYPLGPEGRYTYMVRVGGDGRVTRVDQVLGWDTFTRITPGMSTDEVEHLLGRPYSKWTSPMTGQTVWAWRFVETVWRRCFYAYVAPDGKVSGISSGDEAPGTLSVGLEIPC